jgi:hypothetical protein
MRKKYGLFLFLPVLLILACSDPLGYPKDIRVYYNDDYSGLSFSNVQITYPSTVPQITQTISCGYAIIEMLAKWQGDLTITEETLLNENDGAISTAMGSGFLNEMTRKFPAWRTVRHVNQTNTEMLNQIYASLGNGFPVPVEFAAQDPSGKWTLHFGLVDGMDSAKIHVVNPYGPAHTRDYTIEEFVKATRYETYENMEWYFRAGFNMGIFNKNTFYTIR